jgi:hypothetical protein
VTNWIEPGDIYRYRGNIKIPADGPKYAVMGPAPCRGCGALLWFAYSQTREGWNGPVVRGELAMRERGGKRHQCPA